MMTVRELLTIIATDKVTIAYWNEGTVNEEYTKTEAITKYGCYKVTYAHAVERNHIRIYINKEE